MRSSHMKAELGSLVIEVLWVHVVVQYLPSTCISP